MYPPPATTTPGTRPVAVTRAARALLVAVLLTVGIAATAMVSSVVAFDRYESSYSRRTLDTFRDVEVAAAVGYLILALVVAALAWGILRGRRGTWIATFVVSGLCVSFGFCGLLNLLPAWSELVSLVLNLLLVAAHATAIVLLASRPSREFFTARRAAADADRGRRTGGDPRPDHR